MVKLCRKALVYYFALAGGGAATVFSHIGLRIVKEIFWEVSAGCVIWLYNLIALSPIIIDLNGNIVDLPYRRILLLQLIRVFGLINTLVFIQTLVFPVDDQSALRLFVEASNPSIILTLRIRSIHIRKIKFLIFYSVLSIFFCWTLLISKIFCLGVSVKRHIVRMSTLVFVGSLYLFFLFLLIKSNQRRILMDINFVVKIVVLGRAAVE